MRLFEEFEDEHRLVDAVAGSLIRFSESGAEGAIPAEDVAEFVHFFRVFVAGFHHEREEQTLFPALVERAEVPADRGPQPPIESDNREAAKQVSELEENAGDLPAAPVTARRHAHHIREHVDKDNSVLLPESLER